MPIIQMRKWRCRGEATHCRSCSLSPSPAHCRGFALTCPRPPAPPPASQPSHLRAGALGLGAGPPCPEPPHAQFHLHLGGLERHSMPLQLGGQGGLPALQGGCQSPQKGCPGTWGLVYPAAGGQRMLGVGTLVLALPRCSSVYSTFSGGLGPMAHPPRTGSEGSGPRSCHPQELIFHSPLQTP